MCVCVCVCGKTCVVWYRVRYASVVCMVEFKLKFNHKYTPRFLIGHHNNRYGKHFDAHHTSQPRTHTNLKAMSNYRHLKIPDGYLQVF